MDQVVFAYSDVPNEYVTSKSSIANAAGADFVLMGTQKTQIKSTKPLIAVCAVRTGCGKSQVSRAIFEILRKKGIKVASIRHPIHVIQAAQLGAHIATVPPGIIRKMVKHSLTDVGIKRFLDDWKKVKK